MSPASAQPIVSGIDLDGEGRCLRRDFANRQRARRLRTRRFGGGQSEDGHRDEQGKGSRQPGCAATFNLHLSSFARRGLAPLNPER
jgi:hypothetical protein